MYDICHAPETNERRNENEIFDACRANPQRENRGNVEFYMLATGDYQAVLRDKNGYCITIAKVDKYDC